MIVTGYGTIKPTTSLRRRDGTAAAGSFSDYLSATQSDDAGAAAHLSDVTATSALGSLLALQEISEEEKRRERFLKKGHDMLGSLEKLRQQLLMGEIPVDMLSELASRIASEKEEATDPRLMMIIDDIELRVAVELAKLEMASASQAEI